MANPYKKSKLLGVSSKEPEIENKDTVNMLILIGKIFCVIGVFLALINFLVWHIDTDVYMKISPLNVGMNPMTALLIIVVGFSLWLVRNEKAKPGPSLRTSRVLSIITFSISSYFLLERLWIDEYYAGSIGPEQDIYKFIYGQRKYLSLMAPNTALSILLISVSIFLIEASSKIAFKLSQLLSYAVLFLSIMYIYGYAYHIESLYQLAEESPMAFFTAVSLFLLSSSVGFLRPHKGSMAVIVGQSPTQVIMMRLLAFVIPLCLGYLKIKGTDDGLYSPELGTAIFAAITFLISMSLLGWKSSIQHKLRKVTKRAAERIKFERERFFQVLNCSPTSIILFDYKQDRILFVNDTAKHRFRMNSGEIDSKNFKSSFVKILNSRIYEEDVGKLLEQQKRIAAGKLNRGYFDEIEYRLVNKDNNLRWIYSRTIPFKRIGDKIITALSNGIDITKQKERENHLDELVREKEKELMKTQDKLKFIAGKLFSGIFHFKLDNIAAIDLEQSLEEIENLMKDHFYVDEINMEAVRLFGFDSKKEVEGLKLRDMMNFGNFEKYKVFDTLLKNDFRVHDMNIVYTRKDNSSIKLKTSIIGIIENNRLIEGWTITESV
jgi:PAS domain-containing protein